jgi:hypothetical protein
MTISNVFFFSNNHTGFLELNLSNISPEAATIKENKFTSDEIAQLKSYIASLNYSSLGQD